MTNVPLNDVGSVKCYKTLRFLLVKCFNRIYVCEEHVPEDTICVFSATALLEMKRLLGDLCRPPNGSVASSNASL